MSAPILGVPVGPDPRSGRRGSSFDHVPALHELLPFGGWPGITYAQVCVHNTANAVEREEEPAHLRPIRGTDYFEIRGPKGTAQMALVGTGSPIPGASPDSGARLFFTDGEVERLTGLPVGKYPIWLRPQPKEAPDGGATPQQSSAPAAAPQREGGKGDARVEGGGAAQRQQARPAGDKP